MWLVLAESQALLFPVALAMMPGAGIAAIVLTGIVSGFAGLRELIARLLKWRVGLRWYAVALLTSPLLITAIPVALSFFLP